MGLPLTLGLLAVLLGAVQCSPMQSLNVLHSLLRRGDSCGECLVYTRSQTESLFSNPAQMSQASVLDEICRNLRPKIDCVQRECDPESNGAELVMMNYFCSNTKGVAAMVQCVEVQGEGLDVAGQSCVDEAMADLEPVLFTLKSEERKCRMLDLVPQCFGRRMSRCPSPAVDFYAPIPQLLRTLSGCE